MHEAKTDAVALHVHDQRPRHLIVAVPAHNRYRRTDGHDLLQQRRRTDVAEVPDFVRTGGKLIKLRRQMIMRIRENEDADRFVHASTA